MQSRDPWASPKEKANKCQELNERQPGGHAPKPTLQQISHTAQQLRLEKDVV